LRRKSREESELEIEERSHCHHERHARQPLGESGPGLKQRSTVGEMMRIEEEEIDQGFLAVREAQIDEHK
jgi:hypothetical protein